MPSPFLFFRLLDDLTLVLTHFQATVLWSCSMSPQESPTKMSPTGTGTWSVFVRPSPLCCVETKLISRTGKSRPRPSFSTGRRICRWVSQFVSPFRFHYITSWSMAQMESLCGFSTMTSVPRATTTLRSPSCGWPGSWLANLIWSLWPCLPWRPQMCRWTLPWLPNMKRILRYLYWSVTPFSVCCSLF